MKSSLRKLLLLFALSAVATMIFLSIMALGQQREPSEKRLHRQRVAASEAIAEQGEVSPPWAYPFQELTFPPAAFVPDNETYDFHNYGTSLHMDAGTGDWYAPVVLPDGTQIKRIILIAYDSGTSGVTLALLRTTNTGSTSERMTVSSTGNTSGYRRFVSSYVSYAVNNQARSTWLQVSLPGTYNDYEMVMAKILYKNCYWPN